MDHLRVIEMKRHLSLIFLTACLLLMQGASLSARIRVGKPLPQWRKGQLDIHLINAGRGECSFIILPDGTTIAVDAGEFIAYRNRNYENVAPKPDAQTRPADVYARYMRHFLPSVSRDSLDYFVLSHYHMDHMGGVERNVSLAGEVLDSLVEGVPALYERIPFRKLLDRSYPDYSEAIRSEGMARDMGFYSDFVHSAVTRRGLMAERFEVGTDSQIVPLHSDSFGCRVFNYGAAGLAWNGSKVVSTGATRENAMSCAFLVSYGRFDYWTSGDNNHMAQVKITADAIGSRVDVQKCLHHMSNPEPVKYEASSMQPQAIITTSFYKRVEQPLQSIIRDLSGNHDLFFTNIDKEIIDTDPSCYAKCKGIGGHFVVRVLKGGRKFLIFQLEDTNFDWNVSTIYGPYKSR